MDQNIEICENLHAYGYNDHVNRADNTGSTPLHIASEKGYLDICKALLENAAKVNLFNEKGETPIHIASEKGYFAICDILLDYLIGHYSINSACLQVQVAKILLKKKDILHIASERGYFYICDILLDYLKNSMIPKLTDKQYKEIINKADNNGRNPLTTASHGGHAKLVEILLEKGADKESTFKGVTSLILASQRGHVSTCKILLDAGANVDSISKAKNGVTSLFVASEFGRADIVKMLINHGANVTLGKSPLLAACVFSYDITCGKPDEDGYKDCHEKMSKKLKNVVTMLLNHVPESILCEQTFVNQSDKKDRSPLWIACSTNKLDICQILLNYGANVNQCAINGETPLYVASKIGHADICELLLDRGANVNLADKDRMTPLLIAEKQGHTVIADMIRTASQVPN